MAKDKKTSSKTSKKRSDSGTLLEGEVTQTLGQMIAKMMERGTGAPGVVPMGFRLGIPTLPGDWILCKTLWGGFTCNVYKTDGSKIHDSDQPGSICAYTNAGEDFNCSPYK